MTKLKVALAAAMAVSSIAVVAAPEVAAARPHHGGWHHGGDGWHHGRGHRVRVCRTIRHHHHVERVCHWEYRRW